MVTSLYTNPGRRIRERCVLQHYFHGQSSEEIARSKGIPAATVRTGLKRAIDPLKTVSEVE